MKAFVLVYGPTVERGGRGGNASNRAGSENRCRHTSGWKGTTAADSCIGDASVAFRVGSISNIRGRQDITIGWVAIEASSAG